MLHITNILRKIISGMLLMATTLVYGQSGNIAINSSGNSPSSSAILDLSSNTNGGFLLPSLTSGQESALGTVSNSLLVYNNTSTCYEQYYSNCSCWQVIFCPCNNAPAAPTLSGNASPCAPDPPSATCSYSVNPVADATSYSWTLTTPAGDIWSGFVGNGGRSISGSPTTQDITWWQSGSYTVSVASVNA